MFKPSIVNERQLDLIGGLWSTLIVFFESITHWETFKSAAPRRDIQRERPMISVLFPCS